MTVTIRRARPDDVEFLVALYNDAEVEPFLAAVRPRDPGTLAAEIERADADPAARGLFVAEVDGERAGALAFDRWSAHSRIANLGGLAIHPRFRGRGVAEAAGRALVRHLVHDLGFHRLQAECYAFNERAIRHTERIGFTREGVKRRAYWRHGEWQDGVTFGLLAEDLNPSP